MPCVMADLPQAQDFAEQAAIAFTARTVFDKEPYVLVMW